MHSLRRVILEFEPADSMVVMYENLMGSNSLWLAPNTASVYMSAWLELTDEPFVIEAPPHVLGIIRSLFSVSSGLWLCGPRQRSGGACCTSRL